jgi:hypothetical protein
VLAIFEQSEREWDRGETDGWTGRYLDRLPDLRAVLIWAFGPGRSPELGVRLVKASLPFWFAVALMSEAFTRVEEALNHAESTSEDLLTTKLACNRGWILMYSRSRIPQIEDAWLAAISLARRAGDVGYQLDALAGLTHYYMDTGRPAEAATQLNEYGNLARQNWPPAVLRTLAWLKVHTGNLAEGRQILDGMAARYPRPNSEAANQRASGPLAGFRIDPYIGIRCYLPLCAWLMGQRDYAAMVAREAFDAAGQARHLIAQANALGFAALPVAFFSGDQKALAAYLEQLQFIHRQGPPGLWIYTERFFAAVLKDLRGEPGAATDLQAATRSMVENRFLVRVGMWLGVVADALARNGEIEEASDAIEEAIQYQVRQNERWCRPELLRIKAGILRRAGQRSPSQSTLNDALEEARAIGALSFELRVANDLAAHYLDLDRRDDAAQLLLPIFRRFSEGFATKDLIVASRLLEHMGVTTQEGEHSAS